MLTKKFTYKNFAFNTSPDIMDISNYYNWNRYTNLHSLLKELYSDNIQNLVPKHGLLENLGRKKWKNKKK